MKRENRYGAKSLQKDFPNDDVCLDFIFDAQHSRECSCGGTYRRIAARKQYQCSKCRFQIAPTAGTIFHKSDTPLTLWFQAILAFSNAKSGISARQLERELEVTYKTARRMLSLIRKALGQNGDRLKGIVEIDTGYLGGIKNSGKNNEHLREALAAKTVIMGAAERGGNIRALVVPNATAETYENFLHTHVENKSFLMSDQTKALKRANKYYDHYSVNHGKKEYARGPVHVNNIEAFFSHVKRSVTGVHKSISKKHAQEYLNGYVFHWNNGRSDKERFGFLLGSLLRPAE